MLAALAIAVVLLGAAVGGLLYLAAFVESGWVVGAMAAVVVALGALQILGAQSRRRRRPVPDGARRRLRRAVQRLAVQADVPPLACEVVRDDLPLSWTFAAFRGTPTIHVTTGLIDRLDDRELQAVVGHELGHVVNRDAVVVTLLAGPPAAFFAGVREMASDGGRGPIGALGMLMLFGVPATLMLLVSRVVCRHRELAADRAAALLTGSPAAVAAALMAVEAGLAGRRERDLRRARPRDAFHFVPARESRLIARLWATHPRLAERIERMERLEARMQR
jgi:heat shock protein HtpX